MSRQIVAYLRVSTQRQGNSGLGLEAQRQAVADYVKRFDAHVAGEFIEVESGRKRSRERPQLQAAIATAKAKRAELCCAKLDRVGRRAADVLTLLDSAGVPVVFADHPSGSLLQIGIMAVVAEEEARAISERTKAALAAARARGTQLGSRDHGAPLARYRVLHGNSAACAGVKRAASEFADIVRPFFESYKREGLSGRAMAARLNADGIPSRRGGCWHEASVRLVCARLAI